MRQDAVNIAVEGVMPFYRATGLPQSFCTIQAPDASDTGSPSGSYSNVGGLVNIPCQDAPEGLGSGLSANEIKAVPQTESEKRRHVLLDGFYPLLSPATNWGTVGWRAVIDGVVYDLEAAEQDSQRIETRLRLCKVSV